MAVRERVGAATFDEAVKEYLKKCQTCTGGYRDFKVFLGANAKALEALEKENNVL
jgi:hypothetical protein